MDYTWLKKVRVISAVRLLTASNQVGGLDGKIVLVGVTALGRYDKHAIPEGVAGLRDSKVSGALIHAAALETLLSGKIITAVSPVLSLFALVLVGGLIIHISQSTKTWITVLALSGIVLVTVLISVLLVGHARVVVPAIKWDFALMSIAAVHWAMGVVVLRRQTSQQSAVISDFRADMASAQIIQQHLQPRKVPEHPGLDVAVRQDTCKEVGGDYYDFAVHANGNVGTLLGDVAGKGVAASLVMSNVQAVFRSEAARSARPSAVLKAVNNQLADVSKASGKFITLFYGILEPETGELTYSIGGHCPPMVRKSGGEVHVFGLGGIIVGPLPDSDWPESSVTLKAGDILCLHTDGVCEAMNEDTGDMFGEERIGEWLGRQTGTANEVLESLYIVTKSFVRKGRFQDDWNRFANSLGITEFPQHIRVGQMQGIFPPDN